MALDKKTLAEFDAAHDMLTHQLVLPGIGEPCPDDEWARIRATRRFLSSSKKQTAFNAELAKLARRAS